ncbi:IclR family transcriptional regulator [Nocardia neocaledoniensis NBRC 108232]|uniref:IclR family transcriptional regulator n=1 Tax=Nocardia neocaledoniensis TaxID=236511 RepID=A0A317NUL4_9NOCA|nr:helix-turn-helix domain-containing protein [Nocardia neocaledoniensis]PWV78971.1 IclR family transcriptional regulator [Nocardia neocaledoniensis]GEM31969.1 IclR family transcriptional regulator [Nocardia neocaledoniensis NBRC 108232]
MTATTRRDGPTGHEPRAVQKALALLEAVARLGSGATAKDIAAQTGIAPATAYRLLNLLVADGYLVRIEDLSGFALGRRTRELAGAAEPGSGNSRILGELRAQLRFGIHLASFADGRIRMIDKDPDHELTGEKVLVSCPHASAIGKILMARHPELAVDATLRKVTAFTLTTPADLAAELRRVAADTVAVEVNECRLGRSAVAVPVRTADGTVTGALAAIGKTGRLPVHDRDLIDLLTSAADQLTL